MAAPALRWRCRACGPTAAISVINHGNLRQDDGTGDRRRGASKVDETDIDGKAKNGAHREPAKKAGDSLVGERPLVPRHGDVVVDIDGERSFKVWKRRGGRAGLAFAKPPRLRSRHAGLRGLHHPGRQPHHPQPVRTIPSDVLSASISCLPRSPLRPVTNELRARRQISARCEVDP